MSAYQMAVNNVQTYIRSEQNQRASDEDRITAFTAGSILSIAFCKVQGEVIADLIGIPGTQKKAG